MPEMLKYCGRTLPVTQRADATCAGDGLVRNMPDTVHLRNIRCDGSFHDGCQAACLMYWKEAWLERAERPAASQRQGLDEREQAFIDETLIPATKVVADHSRRTAVSLPGDRDPSGDDYASHARPEPLSPRFSNWKLPKIVLGLVVDAINKWQGYSASRLPAPPGRGRRALPVRDRQAREGQDAQGRAAGSAARRAGPDQEQARDRGDARSDQSQSRFELRSRDGAVLRPDRPRPQPGSRA